MFVIGERINAMFSGVNAAINERNSDYIVNLAKAQVEAGARALDISVGPAQKDSAESMRWLVKIVSEAVSVPLCIDSPHPQVIEEGVKAASGATIINSIKNSPTQIDSLIPLAAKYNSGLICLLMGEKGIPADGAGKLEIAAELLTLSVGGGVPPEKLFFDPILLPVVNAQKDVADIFDLIDQLRMLVSSSSHIIVGLSNLSQRARYRSLLNRTFCAMAISHGLDAAILDPLDTKLMKQIKTAEILMNRELYARSYLLS